MVDTVKNGLCISIAEDTGFCFGVRRADKIVTTLASEHKMVAILGELIHNHDYIEALENYGIETVEDISEVSDKDNTVLVIRTHGVTKEQLCRICESFPSYVDATCPFVKKIHKIVEENSSSDVDTIIIGREGHPEVVGIKSYAKGDVYVFGSPDEIKCFKNVNFGKKAAILVSQTTNNTENYKLCQNVLKIIYTNLNIFDTICSVTETRQAYVREISGKTDIMIVVGGINSSNTKRLYEISLEKCKNTFYCENADTLPIAEIKAAIKKISEDKKKASENEIRYNCGITVCITAGASTPDYIIQEVKIRMNNVSDNNVEKTEIQEGMSFAEMLDAYTKPPRPGERVTGIVRSVTAAAIYVDLGIKHTGVLPAGEVSDDPSVDILTEYKPGDEIEVQIVKYNDPEGIVNLSKKKLESDKNWQVLVEAAENNTTLNGKVVEVVKSGVIIQCGANRVFIPASHTPFPKTEEGVTEEQLKTLLGNSYDFKILPDSKGQKRRAVGSIRKAITEVKRAQRDAFWAEVEVGKKYTGAVKSITPYGAFVDLGGVDGMVYITELSWKRIKHPSEVVSIGDTVDVFVKAVDIEKKRISLGLKTEETNPWTILANQYAVGDVVDVKVVSIMPFGAFAEVIPGIDGLIHISQLADRKVNTPADVVAIDDVVTVKITGIDYENKKVSLSIRELLAPVEEEVVEEVEAVDEAAADEE